VSEVIDIIIVHGGLEQGAYVQWEHYELLMRSALYPVLPAGAGAYSNHMLLGHPFRGFVTQERWAQLLALVLAGHAERETF
jgi:hypothetical protein